MTAIDLIDFLFPGEGIRRKHDQFSHYLSAAGGAR
jgi:hypothetical protein